MEETGRLRAEFNEREIDILRRIAEGQSNQEIAEQLYISVNTVRWYNKQIYDKLDTHSRTAAVARARELGLLVDNPDLAESAENFAVPNLTNLPAQLTPFIGREREVAEVGLLLQDPDLRLVTILGPGGIGKTRLAQQIARAHLDTFENGVFWIALAPLSATRDNAYDVILTTLANTLHIALKANAECEMQVMNYLSSRHMLLAIDNFEHMLGGATLVSHILEAAPWVKILTTSREALGLQGETIYLLTGMSVPERETLPYAQDFGAIKLFLQTARRAAGELSVGQAELHEITTICRLVEGLPLGIELAAAWSRSLSLAEIREQLEQGLDILETRSHNIRHVFDRSWHLLSDAEQVAFARLSVFRGGCTREAIQAVTGANLKMIASLVDKSLLWHLPDGYYAMHELLRQYATEKLEQLPGEAALLARHCDYYATCAGYWGRGLRNQKQIEGLTALDQAYQDIYAAWHYAAQQRREEALRELLEMWYFFDIRSRWREGDELFGLAAAQMDGLTRARLIVRQAFFRYRLGLSEKTRELLDESLAFFRAGGADTDIEMGLATQTLGNLRFHQGDLAEAEHYWEEALVISERANDLHSLIGTLVNIGVLRENHSDSASAKNAFQRALELSRQTGDVMMTALALINLGESAMTDGNLDAAATYFRSAYATAQQIGQQYLIAGALGELGLIALRQGRLREAQHLSEQSLTIHLENDNRTFAIRSLAYLGAIACERDDYASANAHFQRAFQLAFEVRAFGPAVRPLLHLADCFAEQGKYSRAVEIWTAVAQYAGSGCDQRSDAEKRREEHAASLDHDEFDAAVQRGQQIDFETMLSALMIDLEAR